VRVLGLPCVLSCGVLARGRGGVSKKMIKIPAKCSNMLV
jgi:hypothetical protein